MSILVLVIFIVLPLCLVKAASLLARAYEVRIKAGVRAESRRRIKAQRLSLDTQVPSPMMSRIERELQEEFHPREVCAVDGFNYANNHRN